MILEVLITTICLSGGGKGCAESFSAYYYHNKPLQQAARHIEDVGDRILKRNEWMVYVGIPMHALASGQPAKFMIANGTVLGLDLRGQVIFLQWSY